MSGQRSVAHDVKSHQRAVGVYFKSNLEELYLTVCNPTNGQLMDDPKRFRAALATALQGASKSKVKRTSLVTRCGDSSFRFLPG